jgi:hypothetical protein
MHTIVSIKRIEMIVLKLLRLFGPFNRLKYWWIRYYYGEPAGNCWNNTHKGMYEIMNNAKNHANR